ncbi:helix-turn-helix transcriptional regulator [Rhabdothermincola salaria]|uniref:helix-turn-helix transcriptional regulator n=1 Tax=Rhabdothermincola salaria TaxID=2903142 RepID=UPI001E292B5A|nr:helix-turn-helix transcriptional regulator [Rhabdothermincola salaria]MCD9625692.1 helix-turn-helix transcriptional regulator [Rhabdothermincola salaria]
MGVGDLTGARDRLRDLADRPPDLTAALEGVQTALHDITTFTWSALMTVDPETLLPTGGLVEGFSADACAPFWDSELLGPGYNKFTDLARRTDTVATLHDATDGDLDRAPVHTRLYAGLGVADELRAAFVVGSTCWGVVSLLRATVDGPFPDDEIRAVSSLVPLVGKVLRRGVVALDMEAHSTAAMCVVDERDEVLHQTVEAQRMLDDLRTVGVEEMGMPAIVRNVVTRARASRSASHVATRVHGTSGTWRRVSASPMEGSGMVAVMIEPARAADLTPILLEGYGLTEREIEIVVHLARGLATKEIAAELSISAHTVRDHVKAIFTKTGFTTRGELVARVFSEHLLDGFHAAVHRV